MSAFDSNRKDLVHGRIILGAGFIDVSLEEDVGAIETIDLPICGTSALEHILGRNELNLPTWIHLKSSDMVFEKFLKNKFPNIVGFSYSETQDEIGLRISTITSVSATIQIFSTIDLVFADTWQDVPKGRDVIAIHDNSPGVPYTNVKRDEKGKIVFDLSNSHSSVTGYFRFSNPGLLLVSLQKQKDNGADGFYNAIIDYDEKIENGIILEVSENWYDFGHESSFYESRRHWLVGRNFNNFVASDKSQRIIKSSLQKEKIVEEVNWYKNLPNQIIKYVPKIWETEGSSSYEIEFFAAPSLAETLVFGNMSSRYWNDVMNEIDEYLTIVSKTTFKEINTEVFTDSRKYIYIDKVIERIEDLRIDTNFNKFVSINNPFNKELIYNGKKLPKIDEILGRYLSLVTKEVLINLVEPNLLHGDLCFGNMLFKEDNLKIFDPRGTFGELKIAGDLYYDFAKLAHTIIGEYDFYAFDRFILSVTPLGYESILIKKGNCYETLETLRKDFAEICKKSDIDLRNVRIIMAGLFLSLASLHKESAERQIGLLLVGMSEVLELSEKN